MLTLLPDMEFAFSIYPQKHSMKTEAGGRLIMNVFRLEGF